MNRLDPTPGESIQTQSDESDDGFLDGRLKILQPRRGYRAGLDAVMIAAAIPAVPGERIIEAGSGTGVASLCLLNQVADISVHGLEINQEYADLSRQNAERNHLKDRLQIIEGDVAMPHGQYSAHSLDPGSFNHAFANPPYRYEARSRPGRDDGRNRAHLLTAGSLQTWIKFLIAMVHPKGTISLILPSEMLDETLSLLKSRVGNIVIFPLFPQQTEPAKRVIVQATKGTRGPLELSPGLILHNTDGSYTEKANTILRGDARLSLSSKR